MSAVKSETKATKSSTSSDGPGMTSDSSHRASIFFIHLNRVGGALGVDCMACAWRAWHCVPPSCPHERLSLRQCSRLCSKRQATEKGPTVLAEKTPRISAIDTTNFARQIVLDFEFAPVPKQRQRRGLRNEIIEVGAVKLDYHGNVMGEFSQFVQTEFTEGVAFPVRELTGISAVDTAMADPLYVVIKRLSDWIGRYSAQVVCWSGTDRRQLLTECQAKRIDLSAFPTDWADLQAFYTSIMDVGSHGCVSLSDAATWFGIEFDELTGHAHSALADARVTAKLLKQVMDGGYHVSPRAQEVRQRWGMGERAQTRLSSKCPELGDLLLKLKAEGR